MSSSRKSFPYDRGSGGRYDGRRDSGGMSDDWKKQTKCRNYDPESGKRLKSCPEWCGFVHPGDPEWATAASAKFSLSQGRPPGVMGPPPHPNRGRGTARDGGSSSRPPSDSRPERSSDKARSSTSRWAKTTDPIPFKFSNPEASDPRPEEAGGTSFGWDLPAKAGADEDDLLDGWGIPKKKKTISDDLDGWGIPNEPSVRTDLDGRGAPAAPQDPRADKGWAGMAEKRGLNALDSLPLFSSTAKTASAETEFPPKVTSQFTGFSFGKPRATRPSTDSRNNNGGGDGTAVVKPDSTVHKPGEERVKEAIVVSSSPSPTPSRVPPSRSNSATPKPALRIVLPAHSQNTALSLLLQSPFAHPIHPSSIRGPVPIKSPAQQAWSGHIEVLSQAVSARLERMHLDDSLHDRQRLISRIRQKSGKSTARFVSDTVQGSTARDADAKVQAAMAPLTQTSAQQEQRWWPTPRGEVDYEKVLSSLESDVDDLRRLLGGPDAKDDEMEIDLPNHADFDKLRNRREEVFNEIQDLLAYTTERLRTAETFVKNQNEGLSAHVSRILSDTHPPNTTPGVSGLAKLEDLRERFQTLETRMAKYLPDLHRRRTVAIQRAADFKVLKTRYEELRRKERELAVRKRNLTKEAREFFNDMTANPTMADRVLQLTTDEAAQERMTRMMVPKLLAMAEKYRSEDSEYAIQCQLAAKNQTEAWRVTREEERKRRGEVFLGRLASDSTIKAVEIAGKEIDRRWNEVISMQRVSRRTPAIRFPEGGGGSSMG